MTDIIKFLKKIIKKKKVASQGHPIIQNGSDKIFKKEKGLDKIFKLNK